MIKRMIIYAAIGLTVVVAFCVGCVFLHLATEDIAETQGIYY